jgi:hypothetical protein
MNFIRRHGAFNYILIAIITMFIIIISLTSSSIYSIKDFLPKQIIEKPYPIYIIRDRLVNMVSLPIIICKLQPKLDKRFADIIAKDIIDFSETSKLSPILIAAIISVESDFNPMAESKKNAVGLMQIYHQIWKSTKTKNLSKNEMFHIRNNISIGTEILAEMRDSQHNLKAALEKYLGAVSEPYYTSVLKLSGEISVMLEDIYNNKEIEKR